MHDRVTLVIKIDTVFVPVPDIQLCPATESKSASG